MSIRSVLFLYKRTLIEPVHQTLNKAILSTIQEAVVQYEQYEQEVRDLQGLIEEAHRVIQDRPIPTNNIQELQAQILHHEVQTLIHISYLPFPNSKEGI